MRILLFILISTLSLTSFSQAISGNREKQLKPFADSVSTIIDQYKNHQIKTDSLSVYDPTNLEVHLGYVVDIIYLNKGILDKASIIDYNNTSRIFYFKDSSLIKAVIKDNTGIINRQYYYAKEDNEVSPAALVRITKLYPELADYYDNLRLGRTYLNQY